MTLEQAKYIIGNRSAWELRHIIRALKMFELLNTPEEKRRLKAAQIVLRDFNKKMR